MYCETDHVAEAIAFITLTDSISSGNGIALCSSCCISWMQDWTKDPGRETYEVKPLSKMERK